MTTLQTRLAQADKPTRELLEEVWLAIHHSGYPPENEQDTCRLCDRFTAMLDAEAWTSAVEMLTGKESTALADAIACLKARGL